MSTQWRFRTRVLVGPWRATIEQAVADAIAQRQALRDETQPHGLGWRVPGRIEGNADGLCSRPVEG
jgi:hypothetical protein